jgi:hypothetical protein
LNLRVAFLQRVLADKAVDLHSAEEADDAVADAARRNFPA